MHDAVITMKTVPWRQVCNYLGSAKAPLPPPMPPPQTVASPPLPPSSLPTTSPVDSVQNHLPIISTITTFLSTRQHTTGHCDDLTGNKNNPLDPNEAIIIVWVSIDTTTYVKSRAGGLRTFPVGPPPIRPLYSSTDKMDDAPTRFD